MSTRRKGSETPGTPASKPSKSKKLSTSSRRTRKSARDARQDILDAAQQAFLEGGPKAVRLKPIAAACGVTHSGVLYHFGSREGLLEALFQRTAGELREQALASIASAMGSGRVDPKGLLQSVYEGVADPARAELLAFLLAHGRDPFPAAEERGLERLARSVAAFSEAWTAPKEIDTKADTTTPARAPLREEDAAFGIELITLVMFGDLLMGDAVRARLRTTPITEQRSRFRERFAELLLDIAREP
jgi:AcrR family transcriptional regulator